MLTKFFFIAVFSFKFFVLKSFWFCFYYLTGSIFLYFLCRITPSPCLLSTTVSAITQNSQKGKVIWKHESRKWRWLRSSHHYFLSWGASLSSGYVTCISNWDLLFQWFPSQKWDSSQSNVVLIFYILFFWWDWSVTYWNDLLYSNFVCGKVKFVNFSSNTKSFIFQILFFVILIIYIKFTQGSGLLNWVGDCFWVIYIVWFKKVERETVNMNLKSVMPLIFVIPNQRITQQYHEPWSSYASEIFLLWLFHLFENKLSNLLGYNFLSSGFFNSSNRICFQGC